MKPGFPIVVKDSANLNLACRGRTNRSKVGQRLTSSTLDSHLRDHEVVVVEDECGVGRHREREVGIAVQFDGGRATALVDDHQEASRAALGGHEVNRVGCTVVSSQSQGAANAEGVLFSDIAPHTAVIRKNLDESLLVRALRVSKLLPVVAIGERVTVLEQPVLPARASDENLTLNRGAHRGAKVAVLSGSADYERMGARVHVQATLLKVLELYSK